jgi:hypothetical protein
LVADAVRDDVGVQRFLLPLSGERVNDLEGEFGGWAAAKPAFEFDGRDAEAWVVVSGGWVGEGRGGEAPKSRPAMLDFKAATPPALPPAEAAAEVEAGAAAVEVAATAELAAMGAWLQASRY